MQSVSISTRRLRIIVTLTAWLAAPAFAAAPQMVFKSRGVEQASLSVGAMREVTPATTLRVFEYQNGREEAYSVVALEPLLDRVFGPSWRAMEEIQFTCSDGYRPGVPMAEFKKHRAYLAFAKANGDAFRVVSKIHRDETIDLGPFVLVWDNLHDAALRDQGPNYWPFQLVALDLRSAADARPEIAPPVGSEKEVFEGFALFRKACLACHKMNGVGGDVPGIELNRPVSVTEYFKRDWLLKWIDNSIAIRASSRMPAYFNESGYKVPVEERRAQIEKIVRYLEAMAAKG